MRTYQAFSIKTTPQSEPIPGSMQVANSAGGYAWAVDDWARLDRFLILGSEGGTYYTAQPKLTRENAEAVLRCIASDGLRAVARIAEVSHSGRAPKNDPAIFALALAASCSDQATRSAALAALPRVCRIGTHLLHFASFIEGQRGWGRGLRRAVGSWFTEKDAKNLAYQITKYPSRDAWALRDLLRLSHPKASTSTVNAVLNYAVTGNNAVVDDEGVANYLGSIGLLKSVTNPEVAARIIREQRLSREVVPTELLKSAEVWDALLDDMSMTALIRNLATMTKVGLLAPFSDAITKVTAQLGDVERIRKARVHPLALLVAQRVYAQGHGEKGNATWTPAPQIIDALNAAFYTAFGSVTPTNKNTMLALDVSGSMTGGRIAGSPLTPRDGAAAMALVTANVEPKHMMMAFSTQFQPFPVSPSQRLDDVIRHMNGMPFGGTDCAVPMLYAMQHKLPVETFVVYTDSETWHGSIHPAQALRKYREQSGINAKLVVVGMVSNGFTIADPNDRGMLDCVGFDTATPAVISDFAAA